MCCLVTVGVTKFIVCLCSVKLFWFFQMAAKKNSDFQANYIQLREAEKRAKSSVMTNLELKHPSTQFKKGKKKK